MKKIILFLCLALLVNISITNIKADEIKTDESIKLWGYQISYGLKGFRTIASVPQTIENKAVVNWGFIFGVKESNGIINDIDDNEMIINSSNKYVVYRESTQQGFAPHLKDNDLDNNNYFVRTTLFATETKEEFSSNYLIRVYAKLEDGSYVYGRVYSYKIVDVAKRIYTECKMPTREGHDYLLEKIIKPIDSNYPLADYDWGNAIAKI